MATVNQLLEAAGEVTQSRWERRKAQKTKSIERTLTRKYAQVWRDQQDAFMKEFEKLHPLFPRVSESAIREAVTVTDVNPALNAAEGATVAFATSAIQEAVEVALIAGSDAIFETVGVGLGISFDLVDPRAIEYLDQNGATQVSGIDETTRNRVRRIIVQASQEGWPWERTSDALIDMYEGFRFGGKGPLHFNNRGQLIAVTEIGNAYEEGARIGALQLRDAGLLMEKKWSGPDDSRTSEACHSNLEAGWIDIDDTFPSGDLRPLNHPGCRHTVLYRRKVG